MKKKQRLWEKGEALNEKIHEFTVGDDPEVDMQLAESDVYGSAAHARMLSKVGILSAAELSSLLTGLKELLPVIESGKFTIPRELEDCHTTIESYLVDKCGEAGRKIHTGRSRNDQVLLVVRLFMRSAGNAVQGQLLSLADVAFQRARANFEQAMPGYTHFQPAMPTTVGIWFHALGEAMIDCIEHGTRLLQGIDHNPLGVGSGFGTTFALDRKLVADLLGFSGVQRNAIEVQNSRGRFERRFLSWMSDIASAIEKFSSDLVLYTMREFGFFSIPSAFTTGSSIMPQKHNPDVLELLRARAAKVRAAETEIGLVTAKLPSHYHRDFQYTKEPLMRGLRNINEMLPVLEEVISGVTINKERLEAAMTADLFATYDAFREVKAGLPFRDAYRKTAERVGAGTIKAEDYKDDFAFVITEAKKELDQGETRLKELREQHARELSRIDAVEKKLLTL